MENLERRMLLAGVGIVGAAAALSRSATAGQLNPPPGPVSPTRATPVQSLAGDATTQYIISQPGAYVLTSNIQSVAGKDGILINASDVTLELDGFALIDSLGSPRSAIVMSGIAHAAICNGFIHGWGIGIGMSAASGGTSRITDMTIRGVAGPAINLFPQNSSSVRDVVVSQCQNGILATHVANCTVDHTGGSSANVYGIHAKSVINSEVLFLTSSGAANAYGIQAGFVTGCRVSDANLLGSGEAVGIAANDVVGCEIFTLTQGVGATHFCWGISGTNLSDCEVFLISGNTSSGVSGYAAFNGAMSNCSVTAVSNAGSGSVTGIFCQFASVRGCQFQLVGGIGIEADHSRIVDNRVDGATTGIQANGGIVTGNFVVGATTPYSALGNAMMGPTATGAGTISATNPWTNFYI